MALTTVDVLLEFIRRNLPGVRAESVTADDCLLSTGAIDSMGITLLTAFIEQTFDVRFDDTELSEGGLETVRGIAAVVDRRRR